MRQIFAIDVFQLGGGSATLRSMLFPLLVIAFAGCSGSGSTQPYRRLESNRPRTQAVAFSQDGKLLATATPDAFEVWDIAANKIIATTSPVQDRFVQDGENVQHGEISMAFSPDAKTVAIGSTSIKLFPVGGGDSQEIKVPIEKGVPIRAVAFSPDGKWIAEGSDEKSPRIYEVSSGKTVISLPPEARGTFPRAVAFSPDGKMFAAAYQGSNRGLRVWDMPDGKERKGIEDTGGTVTDVAFTPDSKTVAACRPDEGVFLYDVTTGNKIGTIAAGKSTRAIAISGDGALLATAELTPLVELWDLPSGKHRGAADVQESFSGPIAFSPDAKLLATGRGDGWTRLWNVPLLLNKEK